MNAVWYRRQVAIPAAWAGKNVLLHFQAVDYDATVWVNGVEADGIGAVSPRLPVSLSGLAQPGEMMTIVVQGPRRQPFPTAARQTVAALRQLRLCVHAHHRHLADGMAGAGARLRALPPAPHA